MSSIEGIGSLAEQAVPPAARHHERLPRFVHSPFWMLNSNGLRRTLNLARGVILARLLPLDDFGLFGSAAMFSGVDVLYSYRNVGVSACPVSQNECL
jgi:hypothetical protein